ncbi:MAG: hypothetical protein QME66_02300 [Candidatus Eisenbacteria bacterium]|nr:hypothetical protein [Candidatus Eisenbacteria bacterium]
MDSDDRKEREKLYEQTLDELISKQISNSETHDHSILSLSSAFLGLSVAFISDVVPIDVACHKYLLFLSWLAFSLAIIVTIASFIYGQRAIKKLIDAARRFYIEENEDSYRVSMILSTRMDRLNLSSGGAFVLGILLTIAFVSANTWR